MSEAIDNAVSEVLSSKRNKLVHPGDGALTQVYATPRDVTSILAEAVTHRGQYRVSSNNLALGAQSNFILSTSAILENIMLVFSVTAPVNGWFSHIGWGFDLIDSIEITYANSLMQNMVIRGDILKEYAKLCCCSKDEREQMLNHAGSLSFKNTAETKTASVPLSFLNYNTSGMRGSWPMDASVLAGPIQICINWTSPSNTSRIFVDSVTPILPADLPVRVIGAEITCTTITLQTSAFGVKDAMMKNRSLVYSIPARYISIVNESRAVLNAITDVININLNSAPAGMLEGIIIYAAPNDVGASPLDNWVNGGTDKRKHGGSLQIDNLRLQFGSQDLIRYKNREEMLAFNRCNFGDTLTYNELITTPGSATLAYTSVESDILFLPLIQNGKGVFNGHINEHVPSYGGSQLQLTLQFSNHSEERSTVPGPDDGALVTGTSIQIWVGYLISSILEVSQGTVDLQL
tara:strand:- start:4692 stop:6077 length:1386 start_codon:yes stop_codon:yes gene_type:complete